MTKMHWVLIAALVTLIIVLFGHNALEKYHKRAQIRSTQALVYKIMKKNDPMFGKRPKAVTDPSAGIQNGMDTSADKEDAEQIKNPYSPRGRGVQSGQYGGTAYTRRSVTTQQPTTAGSTGSNPPAGNDYYPPTVSAPVEAATQAPAQANPAAPTQGDSYYPPMQR